MTIESQVLRCLAKNFPGYITTGVISKQEGMKNVSAFNCLCKLAAVEDGLVERLSLVALRRGIVSSVCNGDDKEVYETMVSEPRIPLNEYLALLKKFGVKFGTEREFTSAFAAFRLTEAGEKVAKELKGTSDLLV